MRRGKLIAIEGTDGSGKQTQSERLLNKLRSEGYSTEVLSFPRYDTLTGKVVGELCLGKNLGLGVGSLFDNFAEADAKFASSFYGLDRLAAKPDIERLLNENDYLILDRYVESNMGHQCGKLEDPQERAGLRDWINKVEYEDNKLPKPDAVIFLYMPLKISKKLKAGMNELLDAHEADENHLKNAEAAYLELAEHFDWIRVNCSDDGENPRAITDIHQEVYKNISKLN
tara:strand:+ start:1822 stop:2505 length:684 start_codon:yes stop_codon:yes gene_type:complete